MELPVLTAHHVFPYFFQLGGRLAPISIRDQMVRAEMLIEQAREAGLVGGSDMASKLNLVEPGAGYICAPARVAIQHSRLYRALRAVWREVEVWAVLTCPRHEFSCFWLVSLAGEAVRELACVRYSCGQDVLQERIQGPFGQVFWQDAERDNQLPQNQPQV